MLPEQGRSRQVERCLYLNDEEQLKTIPPLPPEERSVFDAPAPSQIDDGASEAALLAQGKSLEELKRQAATNDHKRSEAFRDHFEKIAVAGLWLAAAVFGSFALIWVWHTLAPASCHWLSETQMAKVQNLVTGGVVASLAVGHLKRRLGER